MEVIQEANLNKIKEEKKVNYLKIRENMLHVWFLWFLCSYRSIIWTITGGFDSLNILLVQLLLMCIDIFDTWNVELGFQKLQW